MNLYDMKFNTTGFIKEIKVKDQKVLKRLLVLGFTPYTQIIKVLSSPLNDPVMIRIRGNYLALSKNILKDIIV